MRAIAAAVLALALAAPARAHGLAPRLRAVHTWAFAIGDGGLAGSPAHLARRYRGYDLLVVDGETATRRQIAALRDGGRRVVLAYLDVGSIESYRSWYQRAKAYRLDYWGDWGEWYADTSKAGYRDLIAGRVAPPMLAKGFDGLFLDNVDMISDHRRLAGGMHILVHRLATLVHGQGKFLFDQNGEEVMGPMVRWLDGWNREDVTRTWDFGRHRYIPVPRADSLAARRALRRMRARGLLVTATDYVRRGDAGATARAVANACAAGALPFVSDIGLTRIATSPARCR